MRLPELGCTAFARGHRCDPPIFSPFANAALEPKPLPNLYYGISSAALAIFIFSLTGILFSILMSLIRSSDENDSYLRWHPVLQTSTPRQTNWAALSVLMFFDNVSRIVVHRERSVFIHYFRCVEFIHGYGNFCYHDRDMSRVSKHRPHKKQFRLLGKQNRRRKAIKETVKSIIQGRKGRQ
ncbi:hypothetical protein TNCV_634311 [Trichonephila clavipes]|nr:hypothetical protein TNCV_634311 [Trichonephila clavipes]